MNLHKTLLEAAFLAAGMTIHAQDVSNFDIQTNKIGAPIQHHNKQNLLKS